MTSEAQNTPLHAARNLISELQQTPNDDLKQQLGELDTLLHTAQQRGAGQPAEDLRQKIDELIASNAKFVSVMVHEIRVPMTSIKGYSDMLAKSMTGDFPLDDAMKVQFMETIRSNVTHMEHLVSDISDVSKLNANLIRFDAKMDMYKNIAMQAEKDMVELAAKHEHTLVFETPDGLPLLNLDSTRLMRALKKLIVNALQYTPPGGKITVRAEGIDGHLKVSVIDNGVGMSEEEQSHIGELFWRADHEHVRSFKGHGLGLPIAIGFVEQQGGEFFFESTLDQGSIFGFNVPGMS